LPEYNLYLDEQKSSNTNSFFCLAGIIVDRIEYERNIIPKINELKFEYFNRTDIVFHYTDMKNNRNGFEIFKDSNFRDMFWRDFNSVIRNLNFTSIGTVINYKKIKKVYDFNTIKCYSLAFTRLVNNYILFLKRNRGVGSIVFESLSWIENSIIQDEYYHILNCGTDMYSAEECKKYLSTIGFVTKKENSVGLEIADFVPNSFVRKLNNSNNFHNVGDSFRKKLFCVDDDENIGLVMIY